MQVTQFIIYGQNKTFGHRQFFCLNLHLIYESFNNNCTKLYTAFLLQMLFLQKNYLFIIL